MGETVLRVANPAHPRGGYDVVVGHDLSGRLPEVLGAGPTRVALLHPETLEGPVREVAPAWLAPAPCPVESRPSSTPHRSGAPRPPGRLIVADECRCDASADFAVVAGRAQRRQEPDFSGCSGR